ncbi:unnamed protein product, partial [marine sediment metagenome]
ATFEAGVTFARTEGIISAPEPNHAIRVTIDEALKCKESGESKTILLAHSGHGHVDMAAYDDYLGGKLKDYSYPKEKIDEALAEDDSSGLKAGLLLYLFGDHMTGTSEADIAELINRFVLRDELADGFESLRDKGEFRP